MEINWIILTVIFVCAIALIFYLVKRNMKDKKDVIETLNEPEIEDKPKIEEENEN
jgi:hypothetical protein